MTVNGIGNAKLGTRSTVASGPARRERVEQRADDLADPRLERLDAAQRERGCDEPAQTGVVGRIDREHVLRERRAGQALGQHPLAARERRLHVLRQAGVVQQRACASS